jgi:hypothetical protein
MPWFKIECHKKMKSSDYVRHKPSVFYTPPEPDQAVPDEDELPESLPGFDLAAGLSRLI